MVAGNNNYRESDSLHDLYILKTMTCSGPHCKSHDYYIVTDTFHYHCV